MTELLEKHDRFLEAGGGKSKESDSSSSSENEDDCANDEESWDFGTLRKITKPLSRINLGDRDADDEEEFTVSPIGTLTQKKSQMMLKKIKNDQQQVS